MSDVGPRLVGIWRYPVKSLQGERLDETAVDGDGIRGDRTWGIRDQTSGRILTARREPQLLLASAGLDGGGLPRLTLPDGTECHGDGAATDAALSSWLGRAVTLVAAGAMSGGRAEYFADATDDSSEAIEWTMPDGRFVDAMPLLVLTTASLRAGAALHPGDWDERRFRPNLLVDVDGDGFVEDAWCGTRLSVGSAEIEPAVGCSRCTMVTRPQPGLERDLDVYRVLARHHAGRFGVWTAVASPGNVRVGDAVTAIAGNDV